MLSHAEHAAPEQARELRLEMGKWLRQLREDRALSQRDLANLLNLDYYTFISQLENGRGKIPPSRYAEWADALGVDRKDFVGKILYFTEPSTYAILFGEVG
jgi:transcriptional regulator with XRE-family HTH domain